MPADYRHLVEAFGSVTSADERAWLVTGEVFAGSDSAFTWNEWEVQSLESAGDDRPFAARIVQFWDQHVPLVMSVKSGYAHFSLDLKTLGVVVGSEPEYERVLPLASSVEALLHRIVESDTALAAWI